MSYPQCSICRGVGGFNPPSGASQLPKFSLTPTGLVKKSQKYIADPLVLPQIEYCMPLVARPTFRALKGHWKAFEHLSPNQYTVEVQGHTHLWSVKHLTFQCKANSSSDSETQEADNQMESSAQMGRSTQMGSPAQMDALLKKQSLQIHSLQGIVSFNFLWIPKYGRNQILSNIWLTWNITFNVGRGNGWMLNIYGHTINLFMHTAYIFH